MSFYGVSQPKLKNASASRTRFWKIHRWPQPYQFALILAAAVFLGEAMIMVLLTVLPPTAEWISSVLDAFLITIVLVPLLYVLMLRPLVTEIGQRRTALIQLEIKNRELVAATRAEENQRQLAEALTEATAALNSSLDPDMVLDRILEQTQRVVPCTVIAVLRPVDDWVYVPRYRGMDPNHPLTNGFALDMFPRVQTVAECSKPLLVNDTAQDPEWTIVAGLEWVRSFVLVPLVEDQKTIGILTMLSDQPGVFSSQLNDFLVAFAAYAVVAMQHANIYRSEHQARQVAEALSAASLALTQTLELQAVLDVLLNHLHHIIPFSVGSVSLLQSDSRVALRARVVFDGESEVRSMIPDTIDLLDHPRCRVLVQDKQHILIRNSAEASTYLPDVSPQTEMSCVAVPIAAGGGPLGFCCLEATEPDAFTLEQAHLAEAVVGQAAVAIQNAWLFQQVRAGHERLQSLSHRLVEVQEHERIKIARELHDEAGQMLSSMLLGLKLLEYKANDPTSVVEAVRDLRQVAHTVQENLNRLAMDLRPASLDYLGLVVALNTFVDKLRDQDGIEAQFKAVGWTEQRLDADVEVSIYRIAQEALTNVVRHAQASNVDVLLQRNPASVALMVEDNGVGFDPEAESSQLGLMGIRERCEMLNGSLVIESSKDLGTTLVVEIPYGDSSTRM